MSSARAQLAAIAAGLLVLAALLTWFPPQRYAFYPHCPIHEWLGWQCPGCGMTHALACLVAGRVREAVEWNALSVGLAAAGMAQGYFVLRWNRWPAVSRDWVTAACAVVLVFGVGRNFVF
jgi:hypothetical protein